MAIRMGSRLRFGACVGGKRDFREHATNVTDLGLLRTFKSEPWSGRPDECDRSMLRMLNQAEMQLRIDVGLSRIQTALLSGRQG